MSFRNNIFIWINMKIDKFEMGMKTFLICKKTQAERLVI